MTQELSESMDAESFESEEWTLDLIDSLPFITGDAGGVGGKIKEEPEHFFVTEIPAFRPSGGGPFVIVRVKRKGWNTRDLMKSIAKLFDLPGTSMGCSGLKDRCAVAIQSFSLKLPEADLQDVAKKIEDSLPVTVLETARHDRPLRTGYLKGNEFKILLTGASDDSEKIDTITDSILKKGLPNFYGPQRFGRDGCNLIRGQNILRGGSDPSGGWLRNFFLSSAQSDLFNLWLTERMARGVFDRLIEGDICQKTTGGGVFASRSLDVEMERFIRGEIVYTGPIFGYKMRRPAGEEEKLEDEILQREGFSMKHFRKNNLKGSRRPGLIRIKDLQSRKTGDGWEFRFSLPPGAYATMVLREFIKNPTHAKSGME